MAQPENNASAIDHTCPGQHHSPPKLLLNKICFSKACPRWASRIFKKVELEFLSMISKMHRQMTRLLLTSRNGGNPFTSHVMVDVVWISNSLNHITGQSIFSRDFVRTTPGQDTFTRLHPVEAKTSKAGKIVLMVWSALRIEIQF
jgi:hypothetical protein